MESSGEPLDFFIVLRVGFGKPKSIQHPLSGVIVNEP
jgi:hypothetical protein